MTVLRSLPQVATRARELGLNPIPTQMAEVLIECPICRKAGLRALASITIQFGEPVVRCKGCTNYGDNPHDILRILGHDPTQDDPHEITLRVFDLLWALHRRGLDTTTRESTLEPSGRRSERRHIGQPPGRGDPMAPNDRTPHLATRAGP